MDFNEYQNKAKEFAKYPEVGNNVLYPVLGLCGESGEIAEKIKKIMRDKENSITDDDRIEIIKEIGDVLWYCAILAEELKTDFDVVAKLNIEKLESRKKRNMIGGSGDNR